MRWESENKASWSTRGLVAAITFLLGFGLMSCTGAGTALAAAGDAGHLTILRNATSEFDRYTGGATAAEQQWIRQHYSGIRGYAPYFDRALSWAPPAEFYKDLYAIYSDDSSFVSQHPDWILRDGAGKPLYIPWDCNGSTCSQYAGDIGNPEFRQWWIGEARAQAAKGYQGIFIDDVNMEMRVGNAAGDSVAPADPRTGKTMTEVDWRRYMAEFTEEIKVALPGLRITHNALWWVSETDPSVRREVESADAVNLERGVNDSGLVKGRGRYGFETLLSHVDWIHSLGKSVVFGSYVSSLRECEYEVASYLLTNNGTDAITASFDADPNNWWHGWETDLGSAKGQRYRWNGLLRRDFAGGVVIVNEPGSPPNTVELGGTFKRLDGTSVDRLTLGAGEGVALLADGPAGESPAEVSPAKESPTGGTPHESGESVQVVGEITSGDQGSVVLDVERRVVRGWQVVRGATVKTNDRGRFKKRIKGLRPGRYRVRGYVAGNARAVIHHHQRFSI